MFLLIRSIKWILRLIKQFVDSVLSDGLNKRKIDFNYEISQKNIFICFWMTVAESLT